MAKIINITRLNSTADYFINRGGKLLVANSSVKALDSSELFPEYTNAIMYLTPHNGVEGINLCKMASVAGCSAGCLNTAGRGAFNNVQLARQRKTELLRDTPAVFWALLIKDIKRELRRANKQGKKLAVRINGTSDLILENIIRELFAMFPEVQFYDYTKIYNRDVSDIENYNLTLSYSEANQSYANKVLKFSQRTGNNIAVVFRKDIPDTFKGLEVIDGTKHDLRFLDPAGVVVGLKAKGKAKLDQSGFVIG